MEICNTKMAMSGSCSSIRGKRGGYDAARDKEIEKAELEGTIILENRLPLRRS